MVFKNFAFAPPYCHDILKHNPSLPPLEATKRKKHFTFKPKSSTPNSIWSQPSPTFRVSKKAEIKDGYRLEPSMVEKARNCSSKWRYPYFFKFLISGRAGPQVSSRKRRDTLPILSAIEMTLQCCYFIFSTCNVSVVPCQMICLSCGMRGWPRLPAFAFNDGWLSSRINSLKMCDWVGLNYLRKCWIHQTDCETHLSTRWVMQRHGWCQGTVTVTAPSGNLEHQRACPPLVNFLSSPGATVGITAHKTFCSFYPTGAPSAATLSDDIQSLWTWSENAVVTAAVSLNSLPTLSQNPKPQRRPKNQTPFLNL